MTAALKTASAAPGSIRFDPAAAPEPGQPTTTREWYADPTGKFSSGFWSSQPKRSEIAFEHDELCHILEGVVRLTDAEGRVETYRKGDTFLIPAGFRGVWETVEPVRKFYAVHAPKG